MTTYVVIGKRLLDLVVGLLVLVALIPLFVVIVFGSRLTLGPGVLFRQDRVGLHGRTFSCLKFRTMSQDRRVGRRDNHHPERRVAHKSNGDPRHTQFGRFLRKYSLDELPQLLNLLRGDMSLVGPRPEMTGVATSDFVGHPRHLVRPGLTGPYQLSDLRLNGRLDEGLHLDEQYVRNLTMRSDASLLVRTLLVVMRGTGS